ncbi:hypothetical protein CYLTODRAFT_191315 [Cylindrobasidium torrendii FP15055 ss-10]|uniref:Zn(2)-C6 fungal-type domain-containing protein n=1 Tax=Cylindrobasidium torrendii FP15055 ss-10 TaxID=1314674 RepID=A0A0D7BT62_9AGAR|nr:hypothetical protein CYLTODRAFT_191315 [Cylindrobasidium torrendii FP15055 ss-10]
MPLVRTCRPCRQRKVRCDGKDPICTPCQRARASPDCFYDQEAKEILQRGSACLPCRLQKRKCDGMRPYCHSCDGIGKPEDCQYDDGVHVSLRRQLEGRIRELEERLRAFEPSSDTTPSTTLSPVSDSTVTEAGSGTPNVGRVDELDLAPIRHTFLLHKAQVGLCISEERSLGLASGDTSKIPPALLQACQLWGNFVADGLDDAERLYNQRLLLKEAVACVDATSQDLEPHTALQTHCLVSVFFMAALRDGFSGREHLLHCAHTILKHEIHLIPISQTTENDSVSQNITVNENHIGILSMALYLDQNSCETVLKLPLILPEYLYNELDMIPDLYPRLGIDAFCVTSRCVALKFYRDARKLIAEWISDGCCLLSSGRWYDRFMKLESRTQAHLIHVKERLLVAIETSDDMHARALKLADMITQTTLLSLFFTLAPTIPEAHQKAIDALREILGITCSFQQHDYILLDPIPSILWNDCVSYIKKEANMECPILTTREMSTMLSVIKNHSELLSGKVPFIEVVVDDL